MSLESLKDFSYGESMKYNLPQWKTGQEMIDFVQTQEFTDTSYGDVYIRFVQNLEKIKNKKVPNEFHSGLF